MHSAISSAENLDAADALLEIVRDVRAEGDATYALSDEPWLRFRRPDALRPGAFVEIRYAASYFDPPVRPLLRFWLGKDDYREHILPAACEGAGSWIGRVPRGRTEVWMSPTNRPGRFSFRVTDVAEPSHSLFMRRLMRAPKRLFFAVSAGLVGLGDESELNWRWALGAERLDAYPQWRQARSRPLDPALDRPRCDWRSSSRVTILLDARGATAAEIDASCRSIQRQSYPNWRVLFVGEANDAAATRRREEWRREAGFFDFAGRETHFDANELAGRLVAGDRLEMHALACFVEYFSRHPGRRLAYADETRLDGDAPRTTFKPGWSPVLQRSFDYVGRSAFFRAALLEPRLETMDGAMESLVDRLALEADEKDAGALHRPLFVLGRAPKPRSESIDAVYRGAAASVAVIVPTRDKPDLLADCLTSVLEGGERRCDHVVVVDNDSADARTSALLARLQSAHEQLSVLRAPGPFNFSALCNRGAQAASGDYLLFLNNDTQVLTPDWIDRLLYFASQPDVGAVGAKLLYPTRKTQHVGVLLGMGGVAGHFGAGLDAADPGWTRRNLVPHEVSAVTGACLMVERRKFDAVGGFDAENLPVELNDVDLCLRLAQRGWRTICNPQAQLIHHQSASRGGSMRLQRVYEKERRFFYERWRSVIRDDPYFHPGLSLYAYDEALP